MDEKMNEAQFSRHIAEILPRRIEFIRNAAKEGRIIRIEQESGNKLVKCAECKRNHVEVERRVAEEGERDEVVLGGIFMMTFVIAGKEKTIKG